MCSLPYNAHAFSQADLLRHVTNQEFQKTGKHIFEDWEVLPTITLAELEEQLPKFGVPPEAWSSFFWTQVQQICKDVIRCCEEQVKAAGRPGMSEILGLDFICDASGQAIFLEANRD